MCRVDFNKYGMRVYKAKRSVSFGSFGMGYIRLGMVAIVLSTIAYILGHI